jgi:hypothetical protein
MIIFSPPSLHKQFRVNNRAEHLSDTESGALQRLLFDGHGKTCLEYISVLNANPHSRVQEKYFLLTYPYTSMKYTGNY